MNTNDEVANLERTVVRIVVRPLASPLPLGFFAFSAGTVLLSALELNWVRPQETLALSLVLLAFVAPLELIPCIFGFLARDTGAGTSMGLFGCGWIAMSLYFLFLGPEAHSATIGIFIIMDSLAILALAVGSMSGKPMLSVLLFLAAARFLLTACVQFGAPAAVRVASGGVGLLLGAFGVYGGLALLLEDVKQKTVLPVFRTGAAKASLEGSLAEQIERVHREAGVRQQL